MFATAITVPLALQGQIVNKTGVIPEVLAESSGVAASRSYAGVLWTHNDSGGRPEIYALTITGEVIAQLDVRGASMGDWEDIALGLCPRVFVSDFKTCIYIADTGDNLERRDRVYIYILPEPNPYALDITATERAVRVDFRYQDGPTDVEGVAVDGAGLIWLVTKGLHRPVRVYSLDIRNLSSSERGATLVALLADTLGLPRVPLAGWATGAAISPSGDRLIVRTYVDVHTFVRAKHGDRPWMPSPPPCHIGAIEPQGEAVDFLDERTLVLMSEALRNRPGPIHRVVCP